MVGDGERLGGAFLPQPAVAGSSGMRAAASQRITQTVGVTAAAGAFDLHCTVIQSSGVVTLEVRSVGQHVVEPAALGAPGSLGGQAEVGMGDGFGKVAA